MNTNELTKVLTLEDLRKTTWDYSKNDCVGTYKGVPIMIYLFEVKYSGGESSNRNLLTVQKCNVEEGWIEFVEYEDEPIIVMKDLGKIILPGLPRIVNGDVVKVKLQCNSIVVDILDTKENVIEVLFK